MADKIDQLYDALYADGAVQNSRENFRNYFLAQGDEGYYNRKNLYDALKADGAVQSPTYEDFMQNFNWQGVKRPVRQPAARPAQTPSFDFAPLDTRQANQRMIGRGPVSWDDQQQESPDNPIRRITQGNLTPKEQQRAQKRMQQRMDEIAYEDETGNRMRQPVKDFSFEAPTVSRDEYGNIQRDENGNPLVGFTTDEDAVREHRNIVAEQAEWDLLSAEQKRQRAKEAKLRAEEIDYTEPTLWDTISKKTKSSIIRKGAELVDFMQQMTSGLYVEDPSSPTGYIRTATYEEQQKNKRDPLTRMSDYLHDEADVLSRQGEPLQGRDFLDLLWDGEIGAAMQKGVGVALESLPMTLSAYNPVTMAMNGILMASGNYRQELLDNPDIPAPKRFAMAVGSAAIEQIVEKYSDPVFKYVGGSKILKGFAKEGSEEIAKDVTKKATETLAQRIFRGLGGLAKDAAGEATEEIFTDFGNDALGELLDLASGDKDYGIRAQWEQKKKENPNVSLNDFAWQKAKEYINDGIAGGMAGAYTSGTTQASVKGLQFALGNRASAEDITRNPDARIDPVTMEVAQSYDDGYTETEPDLMKQYNDEAQQAQQNLPGYGEEFAKMVMESDSPVETLDNLMQNRDLYTDEQIEAAADYFQKMSRVNGAMDGALDRIDREIENANSKVIYNTHQASGQVITAQVGDGAYYIIGGDVVTDEETGMPVAVGTGGAVVVMDPVTGEKSVKPASQVIVTSMQSADEMIQYNENVLRQQLMQQADDDFTYGSPANEVYHQQDTVTLRDEDGNVVDGIIVGDPNAFDGAYSIQTNDKRPGKAVIYLTADQLNRMIVSHNGQDVQRASAVPNQGVSVSELTENVSELTENVPEDNGNVQNQPEQSGTLDNAAGEESSPTEDGGQESNQPQSALSRIPVLQDEKGRPLMNKKGKPQYLWHKASVEDAAAALIETTGGDKLMARDNANRLVKTAQAKLEKIRKQEPKGEDPIELAESSLEIKRAEKEVQDTIKQWRDVAASIQKQMRDEAAARQAKEEAAKTAEQKAREAEEARQREEKQREQDRQKISEAIERDREKRNREYQPLVDARKEMADDPDALAILSDTEPRSIDEWVSSLLRPHSILWQDASDTETGLQSELGLTRADMQRMISLLGTRESGAKPFGQAVLDIYEALPEGMKNQYTDNDVRNTLLSLFNEGSSSRMMHLTEENRIAEANTIMQENLRREAEAEMEAWAEAYHLTPEERETYEDFLAAEMMNGAETEYINQIIAENESNTTGEALDMQPTSGTAGRESEGGEKQVQGQGAAETAAADQEQPQPEQGAEADTGEQVVSDDNVPGGTPEPGAIAPSEQLKPTDLRDAVRVESPEIGVAEANARARQAAAKPLSENGAKFLMQRMEDAAINDPQISLTPETWANTFGLNNSLETPIGNVKMGDGQYQKFFDKSRSAEFGMAVQTLQDPDVILIEPSQAKEGQVTERPYSYVFVKSFVRDGQKMKYFASVTVQRDNMEVSVSSHIMKPSRVLERLTTLERLYTKETLLPNSSDRHLAEQQDAVPDLLPTQENNVTSDGKDTNNPANLQGKTGKSSDLGATSSPEQIAEEENRVDTNPSDAQKEAGNYQKGHIKIDGLDISIENPKGSIRRGTDADGKQWESTMHNTYGYIRGTEATDGDHLDVFLSDDPASGNVFVVDQVDPKTGMFDEVKIMIGFTDAAEATKAYLSNYEKGWKGLGTITEVSREDLKKWIESSHRKTKPFADYAMVKKKGIVDDHKADGEVQSPDNQETALRDAVVDHLRSIGVEVSTDWKEGQRILDEYNGSGPIRKMGTTSENKSLKIKDDFQNLQMNEEQRVIASVYSGDADRQTLSFDTKDGEKLNIEFQQGTDEHAGTLHSLLDHYETTKGVITAEDVLRIPEIITTGTRKVNDDGKTVKYTLKDGKKTFTVITEINGNKEIFDNFYSSWKIKKKKNPIVGRSSTEGDTPVGAQNRDVDAFSGARTLNTDDSSGAKVQQNSETSKDSGRKFFKTPDGHAYGYTYKGKLYIDPRIATAETPVHEYGHLWCEMKRNTAPEEWNQMKQVMLNDEVVQPIIERVRRDYPELTREGKEDDFIEEVITQFSGKRGSERLKEIADEVAAERGGIFGKAEAVTAMQRLKNILNSFWEGVARMMGWKYRNASQIADRMMADMLNGVNPRERMKEAAGERKDFAAEYGIDESLIREYEEGINTENLAKAARAFTDIRRTLRMANKDQKLGEFTELFTPIKEGLFNQYGSIDALREKQSREAEIQAGVMEAARNREEEARARERDRLKELEDMANEQLDDAYMKALEVNDEGRMRDIIVVMGDRRGYTDASDYQGEGAWKAPGNPGYESDEARRADVEANSPDVNVTDIAKGFSPQPSDYFLNPRAYGYNSSHGRESAGAITKAMARIATGGKNVKVKVYRAVPENVEEGTFRNGDWVTPSREYAEMHGKNRLEGKYRIIEQEVPADHLWWDGNDVNEWGYDDGSGYRYKNTENNRKLNDLVTRDDEGNVIPPSRRFDEANPDVRFQKKEVRYVDEMPEEDKAAVRKRLEGVEALPATENTITKRDGVSARNAAMEWASENIPEARTVSTEIGDLIINKKSISDSLAHGFSQAKLDAIPTLIPAFEEGRAAYIGSGKDVNGNPITDHYFAYPIDYKGKREYVFCRTREDQNTHRLYIHEVITGEDIEKGQPLQSTAPEKPRTGLPLYRNILFDVLGSKDTKNIGTLQENQEENAHEAPKFQKTGTPGPESERPRYQKGEDALHYAERLAEYERQKKMEEEDVAIPSFDDADIAMSTYNQTVAKKALKWQEAWQDGMISVKAIQDAIEKETGNKATGAEDAYRFENRMHGRSKNMGEQFEWRFYKPMLEAFSQFMKKTGMDIGQAMDYMIAKHGLERNMYYAFRDAMKSKVAEEIKEEREKLEKEYAKGRMSELDYNKELARLKEKESTGVDDAIGELRDTDEYKLLQQDYADGKISYPEYIRGNEELRRNASMRKTPKKDSDGNVVSTNYYDDFAQDFSGLTGTLAKDMYDEAQKVKRAAQRTVDPETRKSLWQAYDRRMREAYQVAREEAERMVLDAESDREPADKLWKAINAATKRTLQISYDSGMMDRKTYNKVRDMFSFYIPLRGWDENKASDAYTYVGKENVFSPAVKKTWGRTSQAENPLAYIGNIAISTIIAGHRNMLKQHFLNYVMNNPTSLVSVSESWYENIGTENGEPVWVLRSADTAGKSADEITQVVNDFNEEMQRKQAEGKAIPVTGRLRLDVNATKGQKAEHVIEVQRAGHTYQLYINGDPKAAQALNGTLPKSVSRISDTYIGRQLTKLNRSMAAFFTSKNPAFVVSNLSRDLNMAGASVAIKEGGEYNARFIANVAKVLAPRIGEGSGWNPAKKQPTGLMPSLLRKYKKSTLDPSDETERLFKEFMEEGGETGFVNMLSVDSFKEQMLGEIARMNGSSLLGSKGAKETSIGKGFRLLGDTFEFYNRCAEDATRFIVYMTSRQMGKSLEDSIADAKDVTLNFNRKGTGDKGNAEIRDLFIFVNPAIQALSNMCQMAKGHPLKFGAVAAAFIAGGALMPIINQWLLNMFGDDDDKEAYWNLPPWVRKNNLVMWIPGTKNFLTIPLAQEFRVFYGMGEMISCSVMDHSVGNMGMELVSSVADLVPINPTGNGGNLLVYLSPTGIQPMVQIGENIDFTGKPIWRENQGNKYAPMYTKAYVSTPGWMVKLSEAANDVTGGNEGRKGAVEEYAPFWGSYLNNPAVWNHLLQGYFGGMYNTIAKGFDVFTTAAGGEMPKIYQTPVINRFLNRPVERDNAGVLGEEYYKLVNESDQLNYELRVWKKKAADGDADAQKRVDEIMRSDDYRRSQVITHYEKIMKDLKAGEKAATEDYDKEDIKDMISMNKTQMMDELTDIDGGLDPLEAAKSKFNAAKTKAERILLQRRIERLMTILGKDAKSSREAVDKALSYRADELEDNQEGRMESAAYLKLATADNIVDDARIKAARARIKPYLDRFKELEKVDGAEAVRYRSENLKWFNANNIINSQMGAMNTNKKLLGEGRDKDIMKLIDANRNRMLEAIKELDKQD